MCMSFDSHFQSKNLSYKNMHVRKKKKKYARKNNIQESYDIHVLMDNWNHYEKNI